ncbi:MAG TPA: lipid-A-disaccharide synthase [Candidatus Pelagibacter bacterium]|nr:lipid-A-disaccharide synthase [Candidatus Pelagibacter bacterium]
MKKIFILTGEASGDKLASTVISKIKRINPNIEYLCVGGSNLNDLGIKSIFDIKEITYIAFTSVLFNIFKIRNRINKTVEEIIKFNPDILFSVDSPDFSLRVSKIVKRKNPKIKTIHFIAPKVWAWREGRVKKMKKYLDHILLLFKFEKKYFDKESLLNTFVGHPLLDEEINSNIQLNNLISDKKKYISLFAGSRESEIKILTPILFKFIKKMNDKENDFNFIFHSTDKLKNYLINLLNKENIPNTEVISDDKIKNEILKKSIFAVVKSGTVSLEVCKLNIPSIIIYKMNFINFFIAKLFLKIKFVNMLNIINDKEIIPELIQKDCNPDEIFKSVFYFLKKPELIKKQLSDIKSTINDLKSSSTSSEEASKILLNYLA